MPMCTSLRRTERRICRPLTNLCIRQERIANEILMFFRADKKNKGTLYINEPIEAGGGDGELTLNDVLADPLFVDEEYEHKAESRTAASTGEYPSRRQGAADHPAAVWL